jgi:hypothetical protein
LPVQPEPVRPEQALLALPEQVLLEQLQQAVSVSRMS